MSKRPSRGVTSGVGAPIKMQGRDGDLTIRRTKEGKILYVKEHGQWHPINTGIDIAQLKKDVDRLIQSVNVLRNENNPYPNKRSLKLSDSAGAGVLFKNDSGVLKVRNAADSADAQIRCAGIKDSNDNEVIAIGATSNATDHVKLTNAETGATNFPTVTIDGSDTNKSLALKAKGTGHVYVTASHADSLFNIAAAGGGGVKWAFDADEERATWYGSGTKAGHIEAQSDGEVQIWNMIDSGTGADISISAVDDLRLGTGNNDIQLFSGGMAPAGASFAMGTQFGSFKSGGGSYLTHAATATSTGFKVDSNLSGDDAATCQGLHVDLDRTVATSGTNSHIDIGLDVDVNSATLGTGLFYGATINVSGATSGTSTSTGLYIDSDDSDTNIGVHIITSGTHLKLAAEADPADDYATISVADTGDLTIATTGDGTRDSDMILDADGFIKLESAGNGVLIAEASGAGADEAGYGQLWVKNDTPNELCFTDDAGTDITGIGKYFYDVRSIGYYASATGNYLPITGYVIEKTSTASSNEFIGFVAPYNGTLEKVLWRTEIAQSGTVSIRVLESADGTEVPGSLSFRKDYDYSGLGAGIADDTTVDADLTSPTTGDNTLDKGKIYAFYISHSNVPYDTNVTLVFKWDTTS